MPSSTAGLLTAVQNAAVERAFVDDADARRHLELAGSLEPARRAAAETDADRPTGPLAPALVTTTTVDALRSLDRRSTPDGPDAPWHPDPPSERSPAVEGAALAVRRFDADPDRAATLANVPVATLRRRLERSRQ